MQSDSAARWNGPSGQAWIDVQEPLDAMFRAFEDLLVEAVSVPEPRRILDVGCGTGATTRAVARLVGCEAVGIDVSQLMIAAAKTRVDGLKIDFLCADAEHHPFEAAGFDGIISRFGVMFFGDPVRAFANLRSATRPAGTLTFVAWRSIEENPFMTTAERAAGPLLELPTRQPDAPGQFAFADPHRVRRILEKSGWTDIDIRPLDVSCSFAEKDLLSCATRIGPVGQALREVAEPLRGKITDAVRAAFEPFVDGSVVRYTAACWMVRAMNGTL